MTMSPDLVELAAHRFALLGDLLLGRRREGTTVFYRVDDANLPRVCEWMCQSLRERARNLAGSGPIA